LADLLITDADRDALVASGLLLGTVEGAVTYRVVASLPEVSRLLHDTRRAYNRITVCGVPAADSGSLRSALTVLQARGTRVRWLDSHDILWTEEVRDQFDQLDVDLLLPDPNRPETERVSGLTLAHLLDSGDGRASGQAEQLRKAVRELRAVDLEGPDWVVLVDAVEHDHRLVANRTIRTAVLRIWEPESPLTNSELKLASLQRSREARAGRFLERLGSEAPFGQELLSIDAGAYPELRYLRPRLYAELARRRAGCEYLQVLMEKNWVYACRNPFGAGLDLQVAFLDRLYDLDVTVHGYPYRVTARVESGADLTERLSKVLESALEDERKGRNRPAVQSVFDEDIDW
jgi:hypothetical protein